MARGKQKVNFSKIQQGQALQITKVQSKKYHSERKEEKIKKRNKEKKKIPPPQSDSPSVFGTNTTGKHS